MICSLMLVTYNRLDLTKRMLDNLFKNTNHPYRLIIIDNGSSDKTPEWLKGLSKDNAHCKDIELCLCKKNYGIAIGRNLGLEIANKYSDPYLSTIDNDIEVPEGWLTNCIELIKSNPRFSIGVNMEGVNYPSMTANGKSFQYKANGNLGSACMVFSRALHEKIGFFNTDYEYYGHEDADWGFRARRVGWSLGYLKENGVHFGSGDLDVGEYREFKNEFGKKNLPKFYKDCHDYMSNKKNTYIAFKKSEYYCK